MIGAGACLVVTFNALFADKNRRYVGALIELALEYCINCRIAESLLSQVKGS